MKRYIIANILCVVCAIVCSQNKKYDRIYESFKGLPNDELVERGNSYFERNKLDSALICFTIICSKCDGNVSPEEKRMYAHALNRSGNIHYLMYNYVKAQDMYLRSLEVCEENHLDDYVAKVYNNLGNVYASFDDLERAMSYYNKALESFTAYHDKKNMSIVLENLIGIHCNLGEDDKANYYLNMADSINDGKERGFFWLTAKSTIALRRGEYDKAISLSKKSIRLADSVKLDAQFKCASFNSLSNVFVTMGKNDSALHYLFKSEKIARSNGLLDMQSHAYKEIAEIGNVTKDNKLYSQYSKLYKEIEDSIRNMKGYKSIKDVEFLFEMNQIDKQVALMKMEQAMKDAQLSNQRIVIFIISSMLLLIGLLLFVTYRQKRKLQYSYRDIFNKNIEIIASEKQAKERYMRYEQELKEKNQYIEILEAKEETVLEEEAVLEEGTFKILETKPLDVPQSNKYQNSPLSEEQRTTLIQAINAVMENTQEFCSLDFTLEKLALLVDSKTKYVSQVINETYGKNFNRYVNEYRIKEARIRLTNIKEYGQYTVKAISQSVGFKSSTNFNLLFKEITGITPSMYQNMILNSLRQSS